MKFLAQDQLPAFLAHLAAGARVVAPQKDERGNVFFRPWAPGAEVELDILLAKQSAKEFVFKQTETYLKFGYAMEGPTGVAETMPDVHEMPVASEETEAGESSGNGKVPAAVKAREVLVVEPTNDAPAQVIFGLRPCDARGFVQMDNVFGGYGGFYFDPYYNAKREVTTLLAVTCAVPRSTCFCKAVNGSPAGTEGVDALFTPVQGGFTVEPLTEKGAALLDFAGFAEASGGQESEAATVKQDAEAMVDVPFNLEYLQEQLYANLEDEEGWARLADRCISCGTCTYVCPNCYCFSINDEVVEGKGERFRVWDNCFNPMYTLETSGHNPRDKKARRFRNRFAHKFSYYPEKYDSLLCSGCGRCIAGCPVRIDLREVLRTMGQPRVPVTAGEEA